MIQRIYIASAIALALSACGPAEPPKPPKLTQPAFAPEASVTQAVGKHEDCTIFYTATTKGHYVTWVRCKKEPKVVEVNHTESCGKSCTRHVKTVTIDEEGK